MAFRWPIPSWCSVLLISSYIFSMSLSSWSVLGMYTYTITMSIGFALTNINLLLHLCHTLNNIISKHYCNILFSVNFHLSKTISQYCFTFSRPPHCTQTYKLNSDLLISMSDFKIFLLVVISWSSPHLQIRIWDFLRIILIILLIFLLLHSLVFKMVSNFRAEVEDGVSRNSGNAKSVRRNLLSDSLTEGFVRIHEQMSATPLRYIFFIQTYIQIYRNKKADIQQRQQRLQVYINEKLSQLLQVILNRSCHSYCR